jgi:hypothetical protein
MSIATPSLTNFTAGEISPRLYGRVDLAKYFNGCSRLENMIVHPHGGATRRSGLRFIAEAAGSTGASLLIPFEFNAEQTYLLELAESGGRGVLRVFKDRGQVLGEDGEPVEVESPYMGAELSRLRHVQSNDTLILTHPEHPPRTLTRLDHHEWVFAEIEFTSPPEQWAEGNQPTLACFFEDRLVLAATPQQPSTLWFSRTKEYYDFRTRTREVPLEDWGDWLIRDVSNEVRDGRTGDKFLLLDGDSFESDCVVKGATAGGEKRYYRYTGVKVLVASGEDLEVVFADTPGTSQIESVHDAGGSLRADCWEEYTLGQRIKAPDGGEPLDEDAFELTLSASQANVIEFLVPRSRLWVGTMSGEWSVGGPSTSEPISPASAKANREGTAGAARVQPALAGASTLFIQRAGRKLREMDSRAGSGGFASTDATLLAEHITDPGLVGLAYAQEPDSVVYALRSDGVLLALTYQPDQEVRAWSRIITCGAVEDMACVYDSETRQDLLWVVVRREVKGENRRFIEVLDPIFEGGDTAGAFFVDSGLSYEGEPVRVLSGLGHLAGAEVVALADGLVISGLKVSADGELDLGREAGRVHAGLAYDSALSPLALEGGSSRGTAQGKTRRIVEVLVRFHNTLGGKVGGDEIGLDPVLYLTTSDPLGGALSPFSGDKRVLFPKGWTSDGQLVVVQDQPLPLSVLMIVSKITINE